MTDEFVTAMRWLVATSLERRILIIHTQREESMLYL